MKNLRIRNVISLILNLGIIAIMAICMVLSIQRNGGYAHYDWSGLYMDIGQLTNIIVTVFAVFGVVFNIIRIIRNKPTQCGVIYAFDLMVAVLAAGVLAFSAAYVFPNSASSITSISDWAFYSAFYFGIPGLFIINFLFFETEKLRNWAYSLLAPILFALYSVALITCASMKWLPTKYYGGIFAINQWFTGTDWWRAIVEIVVIIIGGFIVGFAFLAINRALTKCALKNQNKVEQSFAGGEPIPNQEIRVEELPEAKPQEEELDEGAVPVEPEIVPEPRIQRIFGKRSAKKSTAKAEKKAAKKSAKKEESAPGVYHVSKRRDNNMWQVKLASGKKAIKFFKTQSEAVEYAKQLTETQGGSIRVHSLKGKLKKVSK